MRRRVSAARMHPRAVLANVRDRTVRLFHAHQESLFLFIGTTAIFILALVIVLMFNSRAIASEEEEIAITAVRATAENANRFWIAPYLRDLAGKKDSEDGATVPPRVKKSIADRAARIRQMKRQCLPSVYRVRIFVQSSGNVEKLRRLLGSLVLADYMGVRSPIDLSVYLRYDPAATGAAATAQRDALDFAAELSWMHGRYDVHRHDRRDAAAGLSPLRLWNPTSEWELAVLLDEDTEVAVQWHIWLMAALRTYGAPASAEKRVTLDSRYDNTSLVSLELMGPQFRMLSPVPAALAGISLSRPPMDEMAGGAHASEKLVGAATRAWLLQQPSRHGMVLFPKFWRGFQTWYETNAREGIRDEEILVGVPTALQPPAAYWKDDEDSDATTTTTASLRRHLFVYLYQRDAYVLYLRPEGASVLAARHSPAADPPHAFPLATELVKKDLNRAIAALPRFSELPAFNIALQPVPAVADHPMAAPVVRTT